MSNIYYQEGYQPIFGQGFGITIQCQEELVVLYCALQGIKHNTAIMNSCKEEVAESLQKLDTELQSQAPALPLPLGSLQFDCDQSPVEHMSTITQITLIIGLVCKVMMGVNEHGSNFILTALSLLLFLAFQRSNGILSLLHENIFKQIPAMIESTLTKFNLKYKTIVFAIYACHCTYALTYIPGSNVPIYPEFCTHCPTSKTTCGEPLLDVHSNEALMDQSCNVLAASLSGPPFCFIKNSFEAQFLYEFGGPIPGKLFINRGDEGQYAFTLHVNFFNPEGMKL
ncbi:hypothetical protein HD554DRAFT_2172148 [Boletus coccyginus]|nr:hypothetical protein HD554DRAFT_2172148 [Boletus coccyginus]